MKIALNMNKTLDENASLYFETAKQARRKLKGVNKTIEEFQNKEVEKKKIISRLTKIDETKKQWFEKFRWFISSEGFLVLGGRDATTNEIIIKKYTEADDIVLHTDMAGSPFIVIKKHRDVFKNITQEKEIGQVTIQEAASFTAIHSKAWKLGMLQTKVFWVKPYQVTKEANVGEYLQKGSFMIRGKTNYVDSTFDYAIGMIENHIVGAPKTAIEKYNEKIVIIEQGNEKASVVAKAVREYFRKEMELDPLIDSIIRVLPAGGCQIKKERKRKKINNFKT